MPPFRKLLFLTPLLLLTMCRETVKEKRSASPLYETELFKTYWHAGKAEVSSYSLMQSRYGETRQGTAVLIFVTEDFSRKNHVKLDQPDNAGIEKVNVLKLNFTKNFITGIYPYSMMLSVFTPVNRKNDDSTLKVAMTSQEWCGQVFTQMNLRGNRFNVKAHSYFETEGDDSFSVKKTFLEDEIWNTIRLDHQLLPEGKLKILPGLFFTRLNHTNLQPVNAVAEKTEADSTYSYQIQFEEPSRTLSVKFEKNFPHKILGWEERWLERGDTMKTTGVLKKTLLIDYWTKNANAYKHLRDSLGL